MPAPAVDATRIRWSVPREQLAAELESKRLLVMLHGYGSNAADLFSLTPYLPDDFVFAAVEGLEPAGPGWAWFPIGIDPVTGDLMRDLKDVHQATESLVAWFDALEAELGELPDTALLGFSQGAAMSIELLRHQPERFAGAVVLAGFALPDETPGAAGRDAALAAVRPPVFWGRDPEDPVISQQLIDFTRAWLPAHSTLDARLYGRIGHSLSIEEVEDAATFLRGL